MLDNTVNKHFGASMKNVLIINGHQPYPFSPGQLTQSLIDIATQTLTEKGYHVKVSNVIEYDVADELARHQWADVVILQFPSNWMTIPWSCKKYMDDVFTAGMSGILCKSDGRTAKDPTANYGTGGLLTDTAYMLSVTFNAPKQAFDDPDKYLFQGKSVDDLLMPVHCNYRFFGMKKLPTFASFDVVKNPQIQQDLANFVDHLKQYI